MYDLHLHSFYSDGVLSINEIIFLLSELKITGFSITDHDTVDGIVEAKNISEKYNIDFIPGIEFGITIRKKEVHILGYYIDINNKYIIDIIEKAKENRLIRTQKILDKLKKEKIYISNEEIVRYSKKDIISRSHLAKILVDKKVTNSIKESFEKYLGNNGKAYIEKETMKSYDIINAIKNSGGVAILAHPACIDDDKIVEDIIKEGIDGLEIINSKHSLNDIIKYYKICNKYQLIQTCGSD